ncbi:MAG: DUF998 domain-containing protein [Halobacteriaceae archaeon]
MTLRRRTGDDAALAYVAASVLTATVGIAAAALIHGTWWSITGHALSDLGAVGVDHAWVFNASLVLAGVLGLLGAAQLAPSRGRVLAAAGFALLAGVGLFPEGTALHAPLAVGFFLVETAGVATLGLERGVAATAGVALGGAIGGLLAGVLVPGVALAEVVWSLGLAAGLLLLLLPEGAQGSPVT